MLLERGGKVRVPAMGFSAAWRRCHGVLKYLNGEKNCTEGALRSTVPGYVRTQGGVCARGERFKGVFVEVGNSFKILSLLSNPRCAQRWLGPSLSAR